jgi:hypothetical protein
VYRSVGAIHPINRLDPILVAAHVVDVLRASRRKDAQGGPNVLAARQSYDRACGFLGRLDARLHVHAQFLIL